MTERNYKPHAQGQQIRILPARDVLKVTHPLKGNVPGRESLLWPLMKESRQKAVCVRGAGPSSTTVTCSFCEVPLSVLAEYTAVKHMVQVTKKPNDANSF